MAYVVALRVLPGKAEALRRLTQEVLGPRKADYDDMMHRGGYTEEAYWLQQDPKLGDLLIAISSRGHADFDEIMENPRTEFDGWYRDRMKEIFGPNVFEPSDPPNELMGTWRS